MIGPNFLGLRGPTFSKWGGNFQRVGVGGNEGGNFQKMKGQLSENVGPNFQEMSGAIFRE